MTTNDQIKAALRAIEYANKYSDPLPRDAVELLVADYERIKKQLAKRVSNVELKLMVEVGKIIENPREYAGADPTSFTGRIAGMVMEIERLKRENAELQQRVWKLEAEQPFDPDAID